MKGTKKRAPKRGAAGQKSLRLPQGAEATLGTEVMVLASNFCVTTLISRACLLATDLEQGPEPEVALSRVGRLAWHQGGIPRAWCDALAAARRNTLPIGIRLGPGRRVRQVALSEGDGSIDAVALRDVEALVFRTE